MLLILLPLSAGIAAWIAGRYSSFVPRCIAMFALFGELALVAYVWVSSRVLFPVVSEGPWLMELHRSWIPQLGIGFHLAMDGLSLLLIGLTVLLGLASVICSWTEITERVGFFHFNLMTILAGIIGVFLAVDLILFYFFWELMLVPMYFLIAVWGHENRVYAAVKFFIFTQAGGLAMLASIVALYLVHGRLTGVYTFDYFDLLGTQMQAGTSMWIMLGFFVAFAVKLPMVPFHTWLPDAHTEAPTAGSVILAGLLLKTGGYGLIRFVLPLFPGSVAAFAPVAMALGVIGILYGAVLAFAQTDMKRLVAYTSVSHLGFVLLGVFALNDLALQGAVMQMICHGISTGALFIVVGMIQERLHTRDLGQLGGLWSAVPRLSGVAMVFALASLGLPGLGNFVGELLTLAGAFRADPWMAAPAALGLVLAAVYALWMMIRAFFGPPFRSGPVRDLSAREMVLMAAMTVAIVFLGVHPQPVLDVAGPSVRAVTEAGKPGTVSQTLEQMPKILSDIPGKPAF